MISRRSRFQVRPNVRKATTDIHIVVAPASEPSTSRATPQGLVSPNRQVDRGLLSPRRKEVPIPHDDDPFIGCKSPTAVRFADAANIQRGADSSTTSTVVIGDVDEYDDQVATTSTHHHHFGHHHHPDVHHHVHANLPTTHIRSSSPTPSVSSLASSSAVRKRFTGYEQLDRATFTMSDLIYWNPRNDTQLAKVVQRRPKKEDNDDANVSNENVDSKAGIKNEIDSKDSVKRELGTTGKDSSYVNGNDVDTKAAINQMKLDADGCLMPAPQVKIGADGELIVDEESLTVKRDVIGSAAHLPTIHEQSGHFGGRRITSHSFRKRHGGIGYSKRWTVDETDAFYAVLSSTGPDFGLMQNFFTHRTRHQIKNKFRREERHNRARIESALESPRPLDESLYAYKYDAKRYAEEVQAKREQRLKRHKEKLKLAGLSDGRHLDDDSDEDGFLSEHSDDDRSVISLGSSTASTSRSGGRKSATPNLQLVVDEDDELDKVEDAVELQRIAKQIIENEERNWLMMKRGKNNKNGYRPMMDEYKAPVPKKPRTVRQPPKPKTEEQQRRIDEIVQSVTCSSYNQHAGSNSAYEPYIPGKSNIGKPSTSAAKPSSAKAAPNRTAASASSLMDTVNAVAHNRNNNNNINFNMNNNNSSNNLISVDDDTQLLLNQSQQDGNLVLVHERSAIEGEPDMIHVYLLSDAANDADIDRATDSPALSTTPDSNLVTATLVDDDGPEDNEDTIGAVAADMEHVEAVVEHVLTAVDNQPDKNDGANT